MTTKLPKSRKELIELMEGYATAIQCDPEYSGRNAENFLKYKEDPKIEYKEPIKPKLIPVKSNHLTTDHNDPKLKEGQKNETGQHEIYLVLSEEERAKGFVRPVRNSYIHVGRIHNYAGIDKMLTEEEKQEFHEKYPEDKNKKYVAILGINGTDGKHLGGAYVTQKEFDAWRLGNKLGGCGTTTTMGNALSETYARNPKFYGATFCCGCNKHLPVEEFVWEGTDKLVGS
jgi:hypothetical protein